MDLELNGKVALVAAASKGLGYGVAKALAENGAKVSLCSRTEADVQQAAQTLNAETGSETLGIACDLSDPNSIQAWVDSTVEKWGQIDALLVNAGGPPAGFFKELSDDAWQNAFNLTLMSTIRMIRAALPHMPAGSAILTITSSSIIEPIPRLGLSTVMRAGVNGLVKTLADELAPDGIRINNLIPGRIETDRTRSLDAGMAKRLDITQEEAKTRSEQAIPMKRLGTTDEFGRMGAFLLSPVASYITGTSMRVDGGKTRAISS
ncbi:MAG: SDR family oxidoreductase [Phototrophicaceae bacterium]